MYDIHTCVYILCVCMYVVYICIYVCMYIYIYNINIYIHTYIYTYKGIVAGLSRHPQDLSFSKSDKVCSCYLFMKPRAMFVY